MMSKPTMWSILVGVTLIFAMAALPACAQVPVTEADTEYEVLDDRPDRLIVMLPNRLIVLAQELHAAPVVAVQVVVKTGSIYENAMEGGSGAGLSHFLEHLVSGGTTATRAEAESNEMLGRIGAMTNASTSLDKVRYYINTVSAHTVEAIDLLSDWLQHCAVDEAEFTRERDVIQREFEMGRGEPRRIFWKLTQQARYQHHPARHPTIGYIDEFLELGRDELDLFYRQMYVPNNMVFVVAGDIDKQAVVDQIADRWRQAEAGPLPKIAFPVERVQSEPRSLAGSADIKRPRVRLAWPGTRLTADGDYALDLLAVILGQGESSRLVRKVRDELRVVNNINAYNASFQWGEGFFGIDAEVAQIPTGDDGAQLLADATAVEVVRQFIVEQVQLLRTEGVEQEEMARGKRQIIADTIYGGQTVESLAGRLASNLIDTGDPDYMQRYAAAIEELTAEQLLAAADRFLQPSRMITVTLMPAKEGEEVGPIERPDELEALDTGADAEQVMLDNMAIVEKLNLALENRSEARQPVVTEPTERYVMPNGLRVLIGRSTLVPAVSIHLYQRGGLLAEQPGREGVAKAMHRMRIRGTTTRSADEIAAQIDSLGASLTTDSGNNTSYTQAVCLKQDLPAVLDLFADVVVNPSFPDDEWQKMRPRLLAAIDRLTDRWYGELGVHFRQAYFGEHVWSQTSNGRREVIEKLTADDLRQAYQQRLSADESVIAIFGDVDPPAVAAMIQTLFSAVPPSAELPVEAIAPAEPIAVVQQVNTNKPLGAVQIGFGPGVTRNSGDYPTLRVLTNVLSRWPSGWLDQALRGQGPGLVYAVHCWTTAGLVPGPTSIVFNASPDKLTEALERTAEVLQRAATDLVDEQTLADAKAAVLTREFFGRQSNSDRAAKAALDEIYDLGPDEETIFAEQVRKIDPQLLRMIARDFLQNPVIVVLSHESVPADELAKVAELIKQAATQDNVTVQP